MKNDIINTIHNNLKNVEQIEDHFHFSGQVKTDLGLITQVQAIIFDPDKPFYSISSCQLDIDFEHDEEDYVFNYHFKLDLDRLASQLLRINRESSLLSICLRAELQDSSTVLMSPLKAQSGLNKNVFKHSWQKTAGLSYLFFSLNIDLDGQIRLNADCVDKKSGQYLMERTSVLKRIQALSIHKDIWLVGGLTPQELSYNSWSFFEFLQAEHPEIESYFILDKTSSAYSPAKEKYGEAILTYGTERCIHLILRAALLLTSGLFQSFYPLKTPAYHQHIRAKKVWMPQSLISGTDYRYSFHQQAGSSPADYVISLSESEAEWLHQSLAYHGQQILITGRPLAEHIVRLDQEESYKKSVMILPYFPSASDVEAIMQSYIHFINQPSFIDFLKRKQLDLIIALDIEHLDQYSARLEGDYLSLILASDENIASYFAQSKILLSNDHPLSSNFLLTGRSLYLWSEREQIPELAQQLHSSPDLSQLMHNLLYPVRLGESQENKRPSLLTFEDQAAKERIFEILVEQF